MGPLRVKRDYSSLNLGLEQTNKTRFEKRTYKLSSFSRQDHDSGVNETISNAAQYGQLQYAFDCEPAISGQDVSMMKLELGKHEQKTKSMEKKYGEKLSGCLEHTAEFLEISALRFFIAWFAHDYNRGRMANSEANKVTRINAVEVKSLGK